MRVCVYDSAPTPTARTGGPEETHGTVTKTKHVSHHRGGLSSVAKAQDGATLSGHSGVCLQLRPP